MPEVPEGLIGAPGSIHPYIHALDQITGEIHVVIFEEHQASTVFSLLDYPVDFLDQHFAGFIPG